ncbi:MAG: hypothetical protein QOG67_2555 [Verrucomicrobiota bacterium]|jgi:hypothetical protein
MASHWIRTVNRAVLPLAVLFVPIMVSARIMTGWMELDEVWNKADLVVIAKAVSTKDTAEQTTLGDMQPPLEATGVETEFETQLVFKGSKSIKKFTLHHYKTDQDFADGPMFVYIPRDEHPFYLLFVIKEKDGRYAPTNDQIDPALISVFRLRGATGPPLRRPEPMVGNSFFKTDTYQQMFDKADLVTIADWDGMKETDERTILRDFDPAIKVIGVTTEFKTKLVLKGAKDTKSGGLHHYRFQFQDDDLWTFAPQFVRIRGPEVRGNTRYSGGGRLLLFLKRERDGRYAPVTGQVYPAVTSVLLLEWPSD